LIIIILIETLSLKRMDRITFISILKDETIEDYNTYTYKLFVNKIILNQA